MAVYYDDENCVHLFIYSTYDGNKTFSHIPTVEELEAVFNVSGFEIDISDCFENCSNMIASPKLPEEISDETSLDGLDETFMNCTALVIPPKLPVAGYSYRVFKGCTALKQAPVIRIGAKYVNYMFQNCSSLLHPASIPATIRSIRSTYDGCTMLSGEMIVRPTSSLTYTDALKNTTKSITLYGNKTLCQSIAATANNGNAAWAPWYDPTPAVTNRGQGSYTTAEDMTRMVRNGALAVNTYAPGRMAYQQGDIVREDEWNALVEAAQTIDPTVTYSTHYANLNKIEAAFDSAL